jgi:23S rRNA (cytosine1962-C5)-methyltransferase
VRVIGPDARPIGSAHFSNASKIALRMLAPYVIEDEAACITEKIKAAMARRPDLSACRLVHADGDQLPGLIIDRYDTVASVQLLTPAMERLAPVIADALPHFAAVLARNDAAVREQEQLPREKRMLRGEIPPPVMFQLNDVRFQCDLWDGQKTGLFLDQRENYAAVARAAATHCPQGRALDVFTCQGGFALHLARVMQEVEGVDASSAALERARANAEANQLKNVRFQKNDAFDLLPSIVRSRRRYSLVVVDPPALAKNRGTLPDAIRGYRELNRRALQLLEAGGILVSCSCSQHLSEAQLRETVAAAAQDAGRQLRVLEARVQASDHPVLLHVPETLYLKCLILQVL